jgi:hypothetical protein
MSSYQHLLLRIFFDLGSILAVISFWIVSVNKVLLFDLCHSVRDAQVRSFAKWVSSLLLWTDLESVAERKRPGNAFGVLLCWLLKCQQIVGLWTLNVEVWWPLYIAVCTRHTIRIVSVVNLCQYEFVFGLWPQIHNSLRVFKWRILYYCLVASWPLATICDYLVLCW